MLRCVCVCMGTATCFTFPVDRRVLCWALLQPSALLQPVLYARTRRRPGTCCMGQPHSDSCCRVCAHAVRRCCSLLDVCRTVVSCGQQHMPKRCLLVWTGQPLVASKPPRSVLSGVCVLTFAASCCSRAEVLFQSVGGGSGNLLCKLICLLPGVLFPHGCCGFSARML